MDIETILPLLLFGFFILMAIIRSLSKSKEKKPNPLLDAEIFDTKSEETHYKDKNKKADDLYRRIQNLTHDYKEAVKEEEEEEEEKKYQKRKSYRTQQSEDFEMEEYDYNKEEQEQNSIISELTRDFDLRKAVLYSEIINRKYN